MRSSKHIIISATLASAVFFFITLFDNATAYALKKTFPNGMEIVNSNLYVNKVDDDTVTVANRILGVWYTATDLNVRIQLIEKQQEINITVYNMLGKEVLEVFKGQTSLSLEETYVKTSNLPNGIYICVLQGKNFKDSEKFIISR